MAEQGTLSLGDDILNTGKVGPVDNFCVSDKVIPAYPDSRGSYVGNALGRPRASVDLPAEVSMFPNHTTKWIVYKSGTGEDLSAVEAGSVARTFHSEQFLA